MLQYIHLLRPQQWLKNLFVFAPLFFGGQFFDKGCFLSTLAMTIAFCLASGAVYCLNDIVDAEFDRSNPLKNNRPVASGAVSLIEAKWIMVGCLLLSFAILIQLLSYLSSLILFPLIFYLAINVAYSLKLKQYAIIDIVCIAVGFVLRVLAGGLVSGTWLSHWILIMTFLLTFFLAITKRVGEMWHWQDVGSWIGPKPKEANTRKSLEGYNLHFAYAIMAVMVSVIIVCYILYTFDTDVISRMGTPYIYVTSIWVLIGLVRYMQLIMVFHKSEGPTTIFLGDVFLLMCAVGWLLSFGVIIYVL